MPAGLTGLWQVSARAHSTFGEALDMDVNYARGWSLGLDLLAAPAHAAARAAPKGNRLMPDPLRIAVVGLGYWGPNLVRNLHELPGAEAAAVCDLREDALATIARRYPGGHARRPVTRTCSPIRRIDAVAIATPVSTHYALAAAALAAGKHVFVEKPLAASLGGGERRWSSSPTRPASC